MNKYPLLSNEVNISQIKISDINYNDNKQFCYITYNNNQSLYLQSPILKFIEPIVIEQHSRNNYKLLYLFLTPTDSTTFSFIELINKIESLSVDSINNLTNRMLNINSLIKIHDTETEQSNKQIYMYLKIHLLEQTKIEYNNKQITLEELNSLVRKVNLKVIFELNMLWLSQTKLGLYLKPIKIRAIDIIDEPIISFRDDDSPVPNNLLMTEVDNIHNIINKNAISLNESIFKNVNENTDSFIKPIDFQKKLQNELLILNNSSSSKKQTSIILDNQNNESGSVYSTESSSSIEIKKIARKKKSKSKSKSIKQLKDLLNNESDLSDISG